MKIFALILTPFTECLGKKGEGELGNSDGKGGVDDVLKGFIMRPLIKWSSSFPELFPFSDASYHRGMSFLECRNWVHCLEIRKGTPSPSFIISNLLLHHVPSASIPFQRKFFSFFRPLLFSWNLYKSLMTFSKTETFSRLLPAIVIIIKKKQIVILDNSIKAGYTINLLNWYEAGVLGE